MNNIHHDNDNNNDMHRNDDNEKQTWQEQLRENGIIDYNHSVGWY